MKFKTLIILVMLLLTIIGAYPAFADNYVIDEKLFKEIESNLMCTDGCGMYLKSCDNQTAQQMRAEIREKMGEGMKPEQIYGFMMSIYGEEVMAAPPASIPFNIVAWVTPFLAILGGGLIIYVALDKWVFIKKTEGTEPDVSEVDMAEYEELVDDEIKKYF